MKTNRKKRFAFFRQVAAAFIALAAVFLLAGCQQNAETPVQPAKDTTPPAEVANFTATPGSSSIINLSWKNPADADLYQVEITANPAHGSLKNAIYLAAEKGKDASYSADALSADTEYTFMLKTVDKSLNKSAGVSKTARTQAASVPGAPMVITLSQSPATPTNGSVTVSVSVSTSIQSAKWSQGVKTVDEVLVNGTAISGGSFTVSDNGTYTVAVVDNDGRREIKTITVGNIDKTPPAKVQNLSAFYSSASQKIIVTWTNPADADFAGTVLRYKKGAGSETEVPRSKTEARYEISPVPADDSVYTISVSTKDELGNESERASVSVTASLGPSLSTISLSRPHLIYNDTDLTITAVLTGSNFDLIGSQSDPTVKVGIFKSDSLVGTLQTAAVDAPNNKATVTLTAPTLSPSEATAAGTVYTVKVKFCGNYESVTETFVISQEARLTAVPQLSLKQIASSDVTSSSKTKISVQGINLDIAGGIKVQLYGSDGAAYGSAVPIDTANTGRTLTTLTADIPVPSEEGIFTAKILFGETVQTSYHTDSLYNTANSIPHPTLQVYGSPKFTSFTIPNAGISKEDALVTAIVKGANFKAPGVTASSFSVSCATSSITSGAAVTIIDDATLKVALTIPGSANSYTVTVSSGSESKTGTFTVKDYSLWTPGKIVLSDNTLVDEALYTAIALANPPIAVVCGTNVYGVAIGVALHKGEDLPWAKRDTTGYNTEFKEIICTPNVTGSGAAATATFTGDEDGSDNWDYICSVDPAGTANAAVNYPAFNWVNTYNTTYSDKLGAARPAWYMPSVAELCEVYKNKDTVNASLSKIKGLNGAYADSNFGMRMFWSSSQVSYFYKNARLAIFASGDLGSNPKDYDLCVCCIAGF
ncbi:hypothetical protein HMPREF1221_02381 [Treponema socranskii subsp. paredis ATCC 35535]|nr:hypothetical protein HMPREF1221_02381 [Treponema socranskii subsp. paredis ATCC 35535]